VTKKNLLSDDSNLFRSTIGKVDAVKNDKVLLTEGTKPRPYPKSRLVNVEEPLIEEVGIDVEELGLEDSVSFLAPGLQYNVLKKLRKGRYGLDAEIDLHGLTSAEAKHQLLHFLHNCIQEGCRCVHIVHGKGYRSADNLPVLKNNINLWLRRHKDVQAFCSAPPKDGGTGAVFVLLQRTEKFED
jgi:DNA-nicking Smr family endonuclease